MGGVYRIQTFFGFLYIFYIYKTPKHTEVFFFFFINSEANIYKYA